jgi:hypothetical protein
MGTRDAPASLLAACTERRLILCRSLSPDADDPVLDLRWHAVAVVFSMR